METNRSITDGPDRDAWSIQQQQRWDARYLDVQVDDALLVQVAQAFQNLLHATADLQGRRGENLKVELHNDGAVQ